MPSHAPRQTAWRESLTLALIFAILTVIISLFNALYIVPVRGNRFDFYPRWEGGRALWQGQSPYAPAITDAIQVGMFGGTLPPEADQQRMVYPAYVGVILAPLLALPAHVAIAVWLTIQLLALIVTPLLWLQILGWKPPAWLLALLIGGLLFVFRYPINLYLVGQFVGTILFGFSLAVYLLHRRQDIAAGIILALTAIPPTIAIPLALLLLVVRWRGLAAFIATLAVLTIITLVQIGWWIPDFLDQLLGYSGYAAPVWAPGFVESPVLRALVIVGSIAVLLFAFYRFRQMRSFADFAITIISPCLLLLPQTGNYYLVLLIPPLLAIFQRGGLLIRCAVVLAMVSPWLFRALPDPSLEALLLPAYVLVLWLIVCGTINAQPRPAVLPGAATQP